MKKILIIVFMLLLLKKVNRDIELECKFFPKKCRGYIAKEKDDEDESPLKPQTVRIPISWRNEVLRESDRYETN